ncbi:NAD(P)-dependent oxidoreductase [Glaciecola sp. MH2013]|uniref:NAD-dependent epimerase/dehydratase family protein n=1 Tax=Glaciecola sp. MH2013 TaxID=2785524 RepID=UPI0018A0A4A3|nr:NAD(P)-dependent oxidoreductase [Glaciecola sp. MH2013]MBF7072234.1 NAD(P)-dependent oxidoreductase [Glaciecola sp. MH2013]
MNEVIVTGCFGFIGSNLVNKLSQQDCDVYGIGNGSEKKLSHNFISGYVDFNNLNKLLKLMKGKPKTIYHLAGGSSVGTAVDNPFEDFCKSVNTASLLFEWVRVNSPETNVIVASSAAVYGSHSGGKLSENSRVNPYSNYGYHKEMIERLASMYRSNHNLKITALRIFSVYGNGLKKQLLWDTCNRLRNIENSTTLTCFGTGNEERDWIHISDVCDGLYTLGSLGNLSPSVVNMGTGKKHTVAELISLLCKHWFNGQVDIDIVFNNLSRAGDPFSLVSDCEFKDSLCEKYKVKLDEGVAQYVNWYKQNHE